MKLALSMWSVHRIARRQAWSAADFLSFCRKEGIGRVELLDVFWKNAKDELPEVADYARRHGIETVSYAVGNDFAHSGPEERKQALRQILDAFPVAEELGTRTIRVFSGSLKEGVARETALEWIVDGLGKAALEAERRGIALCLENHGMLAGTGRQVLDILNRVGSPALRSTFDTGNFLLVGEDPLDALETLLPYVGHVHVKDFAEAADGPYLALDGKTFQGTAAGSGLVRLDAIVDRLRQSGYAGAYVLEYEGPGDEAAGIRASYAYFEGLLRTRKG